MRISAGRFGRSAFVIVDKPAPDVRACAGQLLAMWAGTIQARSSMAWSPG
jgi:hypothetical protein